MGGVPLPDLTALSNLRVAAIRRMTEDPALADRCDSCLRDRGIGRIRLFFTSLFAMLGAGGWAFLCYDWDDEDVPTQRQLVWTGAIVLALIAAFFGGLAFAFILIRSWWGRGALLLVIILIVASEKYWDRWLSRR